MKFETNHIPSDALHCGMELCREIRRLGFEAYVVGGCVRDIVMSELGISPIPGMLDIHDVDIATNMPMPTIKEIFRTESNNGEAHGTLLVFYGMGDPFEVTQFRQDGNYSDGRHPDTVTFAKTFAEDCSRRDFTINAMGLDGDGNLIDPMNGLADLQNGVIRAVGNPIERFAEDPLRIIRGIRFATNFGFTIDPDTKLAMNIAGPGLCKVSKERFRKEITSLNKKNYGLSTFLQFIDQMELAKHIPIFRHMNFMAAFENSLLVPDLRNDNVFAVMALAYDDITNAEAELTMTNDEKRLYKFYRWARYVLQYGSRPSWTELVKIVLGDYRTVLAIMQNKTEWLWTIPVALRMSKGFQPDTKKISDLIFKEGVKPGPEFGKRVREMAEQYWTTVAANFLP